MAIDKWAIDVDEEKYLLSEESAAKCVKELLGFYKIKVDKIESKEQAAVLSQALEDLQEAYRMGTLENKRNDDGGIEVVQTIKEGKDKITYRELVAKDKRVMDNYGQNEFYQKQQALLGKLCGAGPDVIGALKRDDLRTSEALAYLFFMV
jgi:hypothetical protein